jgi:hypothetical protein
MSLRFDTSANRYIWTDPKAVPDEWSDEFLGAPNRQCEVTDWGPWTSIPDNPLLEYAVKSVLTQPWNRGTPCGDIFRIRNRDADCVGAWEPWGECVNGSRMRKYNITENLRAQGKPCPHTNGERETEICAGNCEGQWTPWSSCTDGRERRTYSIKKEKVAGGTDCVAKDNEVEFRACTGGATTTSPAPGTTQRTTTQSQNAGSTSPPRSGTTPPKSVTTTSPSPKIPWHKKNIIVAGVKIPVVWLIGGFGLVFFMFLIILLI